MLKTGLPPKQKDQILTKKQGNIIKNNIEIIKAKNGENLNKLAIKRILNVKILVPGKPIVVRQTSQIQKDKTGNDRLIPDISFRFLVPCLL